jgi:hypothetical protein
MTFITNPEFMEALKLVKRRNLVKKYRQSDIDLARVVTEAADQLWYAQLRGWRDTPPAWIEDGRGPIFSDACHCLLRYIEAGYHPERGWWSPPFESKEQGTAHALVVANLGKMIHDARKRTFHILPVSFDVVLDLILGVGWEKRFERRRQDEAAKARAR